MNYALKFLDHQVKVLTVHKEKLESDLKQTIEETNSRIKVATSEIAELQKTIELIHEYRIVKKTLDNKHETKSKSRKTKS